MVHYFFYTFLINLLLKSTILTLLSSYNTFFARFVAIFWKSNESKQKLPRKEGNRTSHSNDKTSIAL